MIRRKIIDYINLSHGEEQKEKVLEHVKTNISFSGSNLWILVCAIIIASVGLNINSTAAIIGAMLISPLMGPIVGAGFALAMYDFNLLKKSAKNLFIATVVSLMVAMTYFYFSPLKDVTSELLARTSPTIYDVFIAFCGGLVGVIAITRVEKGNPIPGVAIATALMPPLCSAGYGLSIGNLSYFLGAFYLYTLNGFFICISTFIISKYLKYQPVRTPDQKFEKQIRYSITVLIVVMILPSFYLAFNLFRENEYKNKVDQFIDNELTGKGYIIIYKKTVFNENPRKIELAFLSKKFTEAEIKSLNRKLSTYGIENTDIDIKQDNKDLKGEILSEMGIQFKMLHEKDLEINVLQKEMENLKMANSELLTELGTLFPEMKNVSLGEQKIYNNTDSAKIVTVLMYQTDDKVKLDTLKIENWLSLKLKTKDIDLVRYKTADNSSSTAGFRKRK